MTPEVLNLFVLGKNTTSVLATLQKVYTWNFTNCIISFYISCILFSMCNGQKGSCLLFPSVVCSRLFKLELAMWNWCDFWDCGVLVLEVTTLHSLKLCGWKNSCVSSEIAVFCVCVAKSISTNLSQLSVMFRIFSLSPVIWYCLFEFKSQTLLDNTFFLWLKIISMQCYGPYCGHCSIFLLFITDQFDVQLFNWNNNTRWRLCRLKLVVLLKAPVTSSVHERTIH